MSSAAEFFWGQTAAVGVAMLFLVMEKLRLNLREAAIEAFRVWGFMAVSVLSIWLALRVGDPVPRIGIGLMAPVVAALVFNNAYLATRRRIERGA